MHKTVGLDEASYELLRRAKRPGESFSDVVRRLLAPQGDWRSLVGVLRKDGDAMASWLREHRERERGKARAKWDGLKP